MKIKLISNYAGPKYGAFMATSVIDVEDVDAKELVDNGYASYVDAPKVEQKKDEPKKVETAAKAAAKVETATKK